MADPTRSTAVRRRGAGGAREARGAAAVEFALIIPLLMLLVVGIVNYGDMLSVRQSVSQAAAEGARAAAVTPGDEAVKVAEADAAVASALGAQDQECNDGCSTTIEACEGDPDNECAVVRVEIDYSAIIPGFDLVLPETLAYTAVARVS